MKRPTAGPVGPFVVELELAPVGIDQLAERVVVAGLRSGEDPLAHASRRKPLGAGLGSSGLPGTSPPGSSPL